MAPDLHVRVPHIAVPRLARRRRPSGEPPPLPRPIYRSGRVYVALATMTVLALAWALDDANVSAAVTRGDLAVLRVVERIRTPALTEIQEGLGVLASPWIWRLMRWITLVSLVALRRWRHLAVYSGLLLSVTALTQALLALSGRMRPAGIEVLASWDGYSFPSRPVVALGLSMVGAMYTLVPRGRLRNRAKLVAGGIMALLVMSRIYLAVDHPTDVAVSLVIGMAIPVVAFRYLTPDSLFPLRSPRAPRVADLGDERIDAIRQALAGDLGWELCDVVVLRPIGSSGSTPLRLTVRRTGGEDEVEVFGKLYAQQHLRADRWYKLARAILYGRLEDEQSFSSVRRLVEHEDHVLRVAAEAGVPVPETFGYVTLTPEREYLLLTELVPDAAQLGPDVVTDQVIREALIAVRRMWSQGIAHRDIKPANVVVSRGHVWIVDLGFGELRPSAWREAVDLATMMLSLALYSSPERVFAAARAIFEPDEIGEAVAAARSVTIPSQLRSCLRSDPRDLRARFGQLAPAHAPIAIQRWSLRRLLLASAVVSTVGIGLLLLVYNVTTVGLL